MAGHKNPSRARHERPTGRTHYYVRESLVELLWVRPITRAPLIKSVQGRALV